MNGRGRRGSGVGRDLRGRGRLPRRTHAPIGLVAGQRRGCRPVAGVLRHARARGLTTGRGVGDRAVATASCSPGITPARGRWLAAPDVGSRDRDLPGGVRSRPPRRPGPTVLRWGTHFARRPARLARLGMRYLTLCSARILATTRLHLGGGAGLVYDLRSGRGLLVGPGCLAPVYGLFGVRPSGVLSGLPGGTL